MHDNFITNALNALTVPKLDNYSFMTPLKIVNQQHLFYLNLTLLCIYRVENLILHSHSSDLKKSCMSLTNISENQIIPMLIKHYKKHNLEIHGEIFFFFMSSDSP